MKNLASSGCVHTCVCGDWVDKWVSPTKLLQPRTFRIWMPSVSEVQVRISGIFLLHSWGVVKSVDHSFTHGNSSRRFGHVNSSETVDSHCGMTTRRLHVSLLQNAKSSKSSVLMPSFQTIISS